MALFIELFLLGVGLSMDALPSLSVRGSEWENSIKAGSDHRSLFRRISGAHAAYRLASWQSVPAIYHQYWPLDCFYSAWLHRWQDDGRSCPWMEWRRNRWGMDAPIATKTCSFWLLPPVSMHLQSESHLPSWTLQLLRQSQLSESPLWFSLSSVWSLETFLEAGTKVRRNLSVAWFWFFWDWKFSWSISESWLSDKHDFPPVRLFNTIISLFS